MSGAAQGQPLNHHWCPAPCRGAGQQGCSQCLRQCRKQAPLAPGMVWWTGFNQVVVNKLKGKGWRGRQVPLIPTGCAEHCALCTASEECDSFQPSDSSWSVSHSLPYSCHKSSVCDRTPPVYWVRKCLTSIFILEPKLPHKKAGMSKGGASAANPTLPLRAAAG